MDSTNILDHDERSPTEALYAVVFSRMKGKSKSRKCVAMFPGDTEGVNRESLSDYRLSP
jgi:hypothetical protein